jgi:hypothetical protein
MNRSIAGDRTPLRCSAEGADTPTPELRAGGSAVLLRRACALSALRMIETAVTSRSTACRIELRVEPKDTLALKNRAGFVHQALTPLWFSANSGARDLAGPS